MNCVERDIEMMSRIVIVGIMLVLNFMDLHVLFFIYEAIVVLLSVVMVIHRKVP